MKKGVSQARDNYAKFKDAAETHNGTMEAVFKTASKGASEYTAKLMEFLRANATSTLDFAQELFGVKTPAEAMELWTSHGRKSSRRSAPRPRSSPSSARRSRPRPSSRSRTQRVEYYKSAASSTCRPIVARPGPLARAFD